MRIKKNKPAPAKAKRSVSVVATPPEVPAVVPTLPRRPRGRRVYSLVEVRDMERLVEQALLRGLGEQATTRQLRLTGRWPEVGVSFVRKIRTRIREEWNREDEQARASHKAEQVRRIRTYLDHARGEPKLDEQRRIIPGEWVRPPNHHALAKYENLLAEILGTKEPIQFSIDVQVQESLMLVIGNMRPGDMDALLVEAEEQEQLATLARSTVPQLPAGVTKQ